MKTSTRANSSPGGEALRSGNQDKSGPGIKKEQEGQDRAGRRTTPEQSFPALPGLKLKPVPGFFYKEQHEFMPAAQLCLSRRIQNFSKLRHGVSAVPRRIKGSAPGRPKPVTGFLHQALQVRPAAPRRLPPDYPGSAADPGPGVKFPPLPFPSLPAPPQLKLKQVSGSFLQRAP